MKGGIASDSSHLARLADCSVSRGSPHKAKGSMCLASELGIETRWLPVACPELNPVDHLWHHVKQDVLANEPTPDLDTSVGYACQYIFGLTSQQRLRKAGVLSDTFWHQKIL